ncbi:hypothetical protein [Mangrovimonas sp. TPBH4]|uniref:hypothetical protein n=1 Tax=Mangrovimonas sp. TPBH4 TaxID=1645914 RepID=UPI000A8C8345|nr:hypothetical protein [Mangrovimonas sp. TPBH4]
MNKKIFLFLFTICTLLQANAQFGFGKLEDIKEVQNKTLLVVLDEVDDNLKKKAQKKPEKYNEIIEIIEVYNKALKAAFTANWSYSQNIRFVTEKEFQQILNDKNQKNQYAYFRNKLEGHFKGQVRMQAGNYSFELRLPNKNKSVYEMIYTSQHPNEADLTLIIQQFQNYLNSRVKRKEQNYSRKNFQNEIAENSKLLKEKTLLLDEASVSSKLKKEISKVYKYNYKFTSKEEIDEAIISKNPNFAYVRAMPLYQQMNDNQQWDQNKFIFIQYAINAEDGKILGYSTPSSVSFGSITPSNHDTTPKDLKEISENI